MPDHQPPASGPERWSPFPVQDWSTLPADPLGAAFAGPEAAWIDPSWGPPVRQRRWWWPLVAFALIAGLVVGAAAWGLRPTPDDGGTTASAFLPGDGQVRFASRSDDRDGAASRTDVAIESARMTGVPGLSSGDTAFLTQVLGALSTTELTSAKIWRTVTTDRSVEPPTVSARQQTTELYEVSGAVALLGVSGPTSTFVFSPALTELPADVHAGQTWSSSGSASTELSYRSELRAEPLPQGCLRVSGELNLRRADSTTVRNIARLRDWCPGAGLVHARDVSDGMETEIVSTGGWQLDPIDTASPPITWTAPERWRESPATTVSTEPTLGESFMSGTVAAGVPPARTASGLVVRALSSPNDVIALAPLRAGVWTPVWRVHPGGGSVLSVTAYGNVLVVVTSDRRVVGYDDRGLRRWELGLDELAPARPVRLSDAAAVVADLSGTVRAFDLSTGVVRWTSEVGADVNLRPAVGAGLVTVLDRSGTASALDAGTGKIRWTVALEGSGAAVVGDTVVVLQDQTAHALDPTTGRTRWVRPFTGTLTVVGSFAGRLLIATKSQGVLLDEAGAVTGRFPAWLDVTVTDAHLIGWGIDTGQLIGADGAVLATWELPATSLAFEDRPGLATESGVLLLGNTWDFRAWS